jgi:hypothetical protein
VDCVAHSLRVECVAQPKDELRQPLAHLRDVGGAEGPLGGVPAVGGGVSDGLVDEEAHVLKDEDATVGCVGLAGDLKCRGGGGGGLL